MCGREIKLKENKNETISEKPEPTRVGRIKKIFAAAGLAGALALSGCGGANKKTDSNLIVDTSWKPSIAETQKSEDPFGDFWKEKVNNGGLGWVDSSFNAARAGRTALADKQAYPVHFGKFVLEIIPDYSNNQLSVFLSAPSSKGKTSNFKHGPGEPVKRLPPGHPFHDASTDYQPLPQTEDSGQPNLVTETSQKLEWKFLPDKDPSFPTQLIAPFPITGNKVYLIDAGFSDAGSGKRRAFLLYDENARVSILMLEHGRDNQALRFFSGSYDLAPEIRGTVRSNPGRRLSKNPLNTEYAILAEENEELFGFFFAFSANNPMDALSVFTWFKSKDEGVVGGKFHMQSNSLLSPDPKTRLVGAADVGSILQIRKLLGEGVDINCKSDDGFTPLLAAVTNGHLEAIDLLLEKGADPAIGCSGKGNNALLQAAAIGRLEAVKLILKHDKSLLNSRNKGGQTPLMMAASSGNVELARFLVLEGAKINISDRDGFTPLMAATSRSHYEMAKYLVEELRVGLESRDNEGITALMGTALIGNAKMARYLLGKGADPRAAAQNGGTSLMVASQNGHLEIVQALLEHDSSLVEIKSKSGATAFMLAIAHHKWDVADYLLGKGANINALTPKGETILSAMVRDQDAEATDYLLEHGADPNAGAGISIFISIAHGDLELLKKFETHGARLDIGGTGPQNPTTLVDTAAYAGRLDILKYLVEEKGMSAVTGKPGDDSSPLGEGVPTPLTSACTHPQPSLEVLEYLIKHKAKVDMMDGTGELPLTKAASNGNLDAIKLLVKNRAKVNAKNRDGKTALQICKENGHEEAAKYLKSKGAK